MKFEGSVDYQDLGISVSLRVGSKLSLTLATTENILCAKKTECKYSVFFVLVDQSSQKHFLLTEEAKHSTEQYFGDLTTLTYSEFCNSFFSLNLDLGCWIDVTTNVVTLVSGIFGLVPLYYYLSDNTLFFSSSYNSIINRVRSEHLLSLNKTTIYNYLTRRDWDKTVSKDTFFNEVQAVFPGHSLTINHFKATIQEPYLNFEPEKYIRKEGDESDLLHYYGQLFQEKFTNVFRRLVSKEEESSSIGTQLSGGLDSSFISGLLRMMFPKSNIGTFFLQTTPTPNIDNRYADLVVRHINANHSIIDIPDHFADVFVDSIRLNAMPSKLVSSGLPGFFVRDTALHTETRLLFTGQGGDEIVGYGSSHLQDLFDNNDWKSIWLVAQELQKAKEKTGELSDYDNISRDSQIQLRFNSILYSLLRKQKSIFIILKKLISIADRRVSYYYISNIIRQVLQRKRTRPLPDKLFLNSSFYGTLKDTDLDKSYLKKHILKTKSGIDFSNVYSDLVINISRVFYNLNLVHPVKVYLPFFDKEVFEVSLAVPIKLKFLNGLQRGHMREAMKNLLPEEVVVRPDKFVFTAFVKKVSLQMHDHAKALLVEDARVWNYANYNFYHESVDLLQSSQGKVQMELVRRNTYVLRVINLAIWLDEFKEYYDEEI